MFTHAATLKIIKKVKWTTQKNRNIIEKGRIVAGGSNMLKFLALVSVPVCIGQPTWKLLQTT